VARRRAREATARVLVLLVSLAGGVATAGGLEPDDRYLRLVDRYRSGEAGAASELAEVVRSGWLPRAQCRARAECEAAAVLNLHAASRLYEARVVDRGDDLVGATRPMVSRQAAAFAFDWLLAAGFLHQGFGDHGRGFDLYTAGLALRPRNASALLARATALEFSVLPDGFGGIVVSDRDVWRVLYGGGEPPSELSYQLANPRTEAPYRGHLLELVRRQYRAVLELDPASTEARLRLGRVLDALGRRGEAEVELRAVAASREDPLCTAIARLCLARFESSPDAAATAYRSALEIDPTLSPAWLGLSQSLHASGDRSGALAALEQMLSLGNTGALSAWVRYHLGRGRAFPEALDALRARLTPPR
jgi:tetratricopeptide (TPR) repeat protein